MATEIQDKIKASGSFTITLAGLVDGAAQASASVATQGCSRCLITLNIDFDAAPAAGKLIRVYLLKHNGTVGTDGWNKTNSVIVPLNAPELGTITTSASATTPFTFEADAAIHGALGPDIGIAVKNETGTTFGATEANHTKGYALILPEIQ